MSPHAPTIARDGEVETPTEEELAAALSRRKTMVLTTFRKDGTPVATPVSVAVDGGRIFFRTYAQTWKFKRLRRNPLVEVTPSTFRGKPRGPTLAGRARLLDGGDEKAARRALARRHPLLQGSLVPWVHRLLRYTTVHYEITARGA
ncbi:MAG: PPOX class F420-dependent oxidoreductase [Thermoleophilaceae bacterium]|nr:PPOX class F420-dependent oxidoreductase [Thermoleophilaceae bacterium]